MQLVKPKAGLGVKALMLATLLPLLSFAQQINYNVSLIHGIVMCESSRRIPITVYILYIYIHSEA